MERNFSKVKLDFSDCLNVFQLFQKGMQLVSVDLCSWVCGCTYTIKYSYIANYIRI